MVVCAYTTGHIMSFTTTEYTKENIKEILSPYKDTGGLIFVSGPARTGKTQLMKEFWLVSVEQGYTFHTQNRAATSLSYDELQRLKQWCFDTQTIVAIELRSKDMDSIPWLWLELVDICIEVERDRKNNIGTLTIVGTTGKKKELVFKTKLAAGAGLDIQERSSKQALNANF